MRKLILIGRSGAGKTTLTQALKGEGINYRKTQAVNYQDWLIDTPGEYAENASLGAALALYSYEADVVGLLLASSEPYSLYPPNITCMVNREVIGIVTLRKGYPPDRADRWLRLSGCKKVFHIDSFTGKGIPDLIEFLKKPIK